jgi:integrase
MKKSAINLTDRAIKSFKPKATAYDEKDKQVPGLHVRVLPSGQKTFVLLARYPGPNPHPTRRALGSYGELTLEAAREKARQWRVLIKRGKDPAAEERRQRTEQEEREGNTFAAIADAYFREVLPNQRRGAHVKRDITKVFINEAGWGSRPIHEITALDVRSVIRRYAEQGKVFHTHNLLSYLRRVFNWAIEQQCYGIETSPCDRLKPKTIIGKKQARTRVLSDVELRAVWLAASNMPYPSGPLFKLLVLLGQRRTEVTEMQWSEIDLAAKTWTIPLERMKAGAAHMVPLPDDAVEILAALPRHDGPYVFSVNGGRSPVRSHGDFKQALDAEVTKVLGQAPTPFVVHDLRRTMRTRLSAIPNISDLVRELVIGHTKPGLHKVYDQYAYLDEKRFALDAWAAKLQSIVNPPAANVVELRAAQ